MQRHAEDLQLNEHGHSKHKAQSDPFDRCKNERILLPQMDQEPCKQEEQHLGDEQDINTQHPRSVISSSMVL